MLAALAGHGSTHGSHAPLYLKRKYVPSDWMHSSAPMSTTPYLTRGLPNTSFSLACPGSVRPVSRHGELARDRNQPSANPSVSSIGTFRKCLSRVKSRPPHSIVAAAIQMSFVGMGVPFLLSKVNIMQ